MKKIVTTIGVLVLVSVLAAPVFAYRGGWGPKGGYGPGSCWSEGGRNANLTEEQRKDLGKLEDVFFNDTSEIRRNLWAKADELEAVLRGTDPDRKKVKDLQKEVSALRTEMADKRTDFILEAKKIAPDAGFGRGFRKGGGFGACAKGNNGPRGGYGPGSCWK